MSHHKFQIDLTLVAPFQTKATAAGEYGVDSPCARDHKGNFYIPGTLVKGKVREAWTWLRGWDVGVVETRIPTEGQVDDWFGLGTADAARPVDTASGQTFLPSMGRVRFSDFACRTEQNKVARERLRVRIEIDDTKGCAGEGMLQVLETPFPTATSVAFSGIVTFDGSEQDARKFRQALDAGLRATTTLGAHRAIGFGRIEKVAVAELSEAAKRGTARSACDWSLVHGNESSVVLRLYTDDPLCLTERGSAANVFHSGTVIGGGMLKGALAAQIRRHHGVDPADRNASGALPMLRKYFSSVRFRQALPRTAEGRTHSAIPQSIFTYKDAEDKVHALDTVLNNVPPTDLVPNFQHDWKAGDEDTVATLFPQIGLKRELRVRTKISAANRRAEDGLLFAYELVLPETEKGERVHWETTVDLPSGIPPVDRHQFWKELGEALGDGLASIGKTKARFTVKAAPATGTGAVVSGGELVSLLFRSPALIGNPETIQGRSDHEALHGFYADYFGEASGGTLVLQHFFAQQALMGGIYQYHRFQRAATNHHYHPWLLTQPGSVFVFGALPGAGAYLESWLAGGLPLVGPMRAFYGLKGEDDSGDDWSVCPYVPANGYNEIAINAHEAWRSICR